MSKQACLFPQTIGDDQASPELSYYLVGAGKKELQVSGLPRKINIVGDTSACSPTSYLYLPTHYNPPLVQSSRRVLRADEMDHDIEEVIYV